MMEFTTSIHDEVPKFLLAPPNHADEREQLVKRGNYESR